MTADLRQRRCVAAANFADADDRDVNNRSSLRLFRCKHNFTLGATIVFLKMQTPGKVQKLSASASLLDTKTAPKRRARRDLAVAVAEKVDCAPMRAGPDLLGVVAERDGRSVDRDLLNPSTDAQRASFRMCFLS